MSRIGIILVCSSLGLGVDPSLSLGQATSKPVERVTSKDLASSVAGGQKPEPANHHYKVIYWFDGAGWKSQPYDVALGEYTKAVETWSTRTEFDASGFARPGKLAIVRDVYLEDGAVETRKERLAAAIADEFQRLRMNGTRDRSAARSIRADQPGPTRTSKTSRVLEGSRTSPGASGVDPSSVPQASPFPYPYSRPHP